MSPSGSGGNGGLNGTTYRSQSPSELDSPSRGHGGGDRDRYIYVSKMRERSYKEKYVGKLSICYNESSSFFVVVVVVRCCCKFVTSSISICYKVFRSF